MLFTLHSYLSLLCSFTPKICPPPTLSRPGGSHIFSDWQEQQLQQGAGREAADSRWLEHICAPVNHPSTFAEMIFAFKNTAMLLQDLHNAISKATHAPKPLITTKHQWHHWEKKPITQYSHSLEATSVSGPCLLFSGCEISSVAQLYRTLPPFPKHHLTVNPLATCNHLEISDIAEKKKTFPQRTHD